MDRLPFEEETISSKLMFEGPVFSVRRHIVDTVSGESLRDIVEHPGGVAVAATTPEGRLVMIRQYRKAAKKIVWEVPAGRIEEDEAPETTALRELREETGYIGGNPKHLISFYGTIGYCEEVISIYEVDAVGRGETDFDEHEAIECFEMDIPVLLDMIKDGEIVDSKTIIAILMISSRPPVAKGRER